MKSKKFFDEYFTSVNKILFKLDKKKLERFYNLIIQTSKSKGKVLIFGNGANASNASHFATDMTKNAKIKTLAISDANLITCFSNDYGFEKWIKKTIEYYSNKNDLVILLSASGESKNLVNAAKACKKLNVKCLSITGFKKRNSLSKFVELNLWIDSKSYNLIEIAQATILSSFVDLKIGKLNYGSNL